MKKESIYEYRIADFTWLLRLPLELNITEESRKFITCLDETESRESDAFTHLAVFEKTDELSAVPSDAVYRDICYFLTRGDEKIVYRCPITNGEPRAELHFLPGGDIHCSFLESYISSLHSTPGLINTLSLEYMMLAHSAFLLHSCLVRHQDKAILFTAPSGTGKSTQGDLWTKYRGAQVLNGDRAGIYQKNNEWRATGLPYAGTSGIYYNENAPIRAIVYLAQGPDNTVTKLSAGQAFRLLYPQINVHHWEPDYVTKISDLLVSLLKDIPVYYFSCTPDERAVKALEKQLMMV